jgi:hypothetical protein
VLLSAVCAHGELVAEAPGASAATTMESVLMLFALRPLPSQLMVGSADVAQSCLMIRTQTCKLAYVAYMQAETASLKRLTADTPDADEQIIEHGALWQACGA